MANSPSGLNSDRKFKMMVDILRDTMSQDFGKNGSIFINDNTTTYTGPFYAIQGINSAGYDVSESTEDVSMVNFDADFTIPNGAIIYGHFKTLRLTGGSCIAYYK